MAKFFKTDKWKKRALAVTSVALASAFSMAFFAACAGEDDDDDDDTSVSATDVQKIKNGNFEFYSEKDEKAADRRALINSPTSWSFTSGSPSSTTSSGIVDTTAESWRSMTRTGGYAFQTYTYTGKNSTYNDKEVATFTSIADAIAHWNDDNVSVYDRLYFYEIYQSDIDELDSASEQAKFFNDYKYSVDYEDVKYLKEVCANDGGFALRDGVKENENNVLMIHNLVTSNSVVGTAQYYTSSTTITLSAGTAAEVSVWVRTDNLYHYYSTDDDNPSESGDPVDRYAGAYIGVTNTVGGTSLDQMQIKNINTNGEWEQYSVYVRASTFATTTFKLVLGLGQGSSSDRYEHVNGYAFFDDITCDIISAEDYEEAVGTPETPNDGVKICTIDSLKEDKKFDVSDTSLNGFNTFALDLFAAIDGDLADSEIDIGLTTQRSGSIDYTTARFGLDHDPETNFAELTTLSQIAASNNRYLKKVYENDLKDKYPFGDDGNIVMLMSANGAAYTAKLPTLTLGAEERVLVSFFVKTSDIPSGYSGASATVVEVVDGADVNKTSISAFDSTDLATVDIDDDRTDVYQGWAQCFFFIENSTDAEANYRIELSYGPTTIAGTTKNDYADGYAAFTEFKTKPLTKTEYSYASTGSQAVKVSLTGEVKETKNFDSVSAAAQKDVETGLALPSSFTGVLGGSKFVTPNGGENEIPDGVYAGLLSSQYAETYYSDNESAWKDVISNGSAANADDWWTNYFGNARQPLVIANAEQAAYGFFSGTLTVSASSYQKISMRVKVSAGAKAYVYLVDASSAEKTGSLLTPAAPKVTYWYNDYGDICSKDPSSKDYNAKTDVLFELQANGLYTKVGSNDGVYYANLYNYDKDSSGNYVTSDGTIAYYYNKADGKYYAYYDEVKDVYTQVVTALPTADDNGNAITRYDFSEITWESYGSVIEVDNTDGTLTDWVTVSFFVATGNESKSYRLEVWSGDRMGNSPNPANSYVFFDNYINEDASSSYATARDEAVEKLKLANNVSEKDNLSDSFALYYTFTFYDADFYLRYDENEDEDELGNPYGSYTQSTYEEQLIWLSLKDKDGSLMGAGSLYEMFLDYSAKDVTVTADDLGNTDDSDTDTTDTTNTNIWLLISSGILSVILLFVIVAVVVRRASKKFGKKPKKTKPTKDKRYRPELKIVDSDNGAENE